MPRALVADRQHLHPQALRTAAAQGQEGEIEVQGWDGHGCGMGERSKPAKKATTKAAPK